MRVKILLWMASVAVLLAAGCAESMRDYANATIPPPPRQPAIEQQTFEETLSLIAQQRCGEARTRLESLAATPSAAENRDLAGKLAFWIAYCAEKQGRTAEAADLYARVSAGYPQTAYARLATERRGRLDVNRNEQ